MGNDTSKTTEPGGDVRPEVAADCAWAADDDAWQTSCGQSFLIIEGTPNENGMRFCCYCGGPLNEVSDT
jgi:hypothetical protein